MVGSESLRRRIQHGVSIDPILGLASFHHIVSDTAAGYYRRCLRRDNSASSDLASPFSPHPLNSRRSITPAGQS